MMNLKKLIKGDKNVNDKYIYCGNCMCYINIKYLFLLVKQHIFIIISV